jgi:hypothetical protein
MTELDRSIDAVLGELEEWVPPRRRRRKVPVKWSKRDVKWSIARAINEIDDTRGLNVADWFKDVRRMLIAKYGSRIAHHQLDLDDVIQQVMLGLVVRNHGEGAWHPDGGKTPSGWVFMVVKSVLTQIIDRKMFRTSTEVWVHTLRPSEESVFPTQEWSIAFRWDESDTHRVLVENAPARANIDMVMVEDLERACAAEPAAHDYVEAMVQGRLRMSLYDRWSMAKVNRARHAVLDFLSP